MAADSPPTVASPAIKGMQWRPLTVTKVDRPSDSNVVLRLAIDPPGSLPFTAGQFVYLHHVFDGKEDRAAYSIASPPYVPDYIELCVKKVQGGPFSTWLYERHPGDTVSVSRALGSFHFKSLPDRPVVFLATGTGIAPLRAMLLERLRAGDRRELWLYYGVGRVVNLTYHDEFVALRQKHPSFHYVPVVSRAQTLEWSGERGWIQEPFLREFANRKDYDAYVCGVKRMVDDVVRLLQSKGVADESIHFEKYV